jgi:hypothetical protein
MLVNEITEVICKALFNCVDKWERNEIDPSEEEVIFLGQYYNLIKEIEIRWAEFEQQINKDEMKDEEEKQQGIKIIKKNIEAFNIYEPKLKKLFQKWQEKHKHQHGEENEDLDSTELMEERLVELQNQIEELKKDKTNSLIDANKQQIQQKINILEEQVGNIKKQIKQLKGENSSSTRSSTNSDTNKSSGKGKGFPAWGWVLIILGVLAVAGAAAYFILERKEKPKPKKAKKVDKQNG